MSKFRGFSLLEVVFAATLLTIVLMSLGTLIPRSVMNLRDRGDQERAIQLAEYSVAAIRALPFDKVVYGLYDGDRLPPDPPLNAGSSVQYPPLPYNGSPQLNGTRDGSTVLQTYTLKVSTTPVATVTSPPMQMRQLTVTVLWNETREGVQVKQNWTTTTYLDPP